MERFVAELELLDQNLISVLGSDNQLIQEVSRYIVESGGKRVRPLITLLVGKSLGADTKDFLDFATSVELVHTASLMHDDVVDFGETRRGKKTVFYLWGANVSVLMGDFIVSRAYNLVAMRDRLDLLREFVMAVEMMAEGELIQLSHRKNVNIRMEQYYQIIDRKTSALFRLAFILVPIYLGREDLILTLSDAGISVGRAFQIIDDIIDYTSPGEILGKDKFKDFYEKKPTLPLILYFQRGEQEKVKELWDKDKIPGEKIEKLVEEMEHKGVFDQARHIARQHTLTAMKKIELLPEGEGKEQLKALLEVLTGRIS